MVIEKTLDWMKTLQRKNLIKKLHGDKKTKSSKGVADGVSLISRILTLFTFYN